MENLNILIVGAGVAGLTCANLLKNQGMDAFIIEREPSQSFNASGYMLGLLPLGGRVFNQINLRDQYFRNSIQMDLYNVHSSSGSLIRSYPLEFINKQYGSYRGISRQHLIELLMQKIDRKQILFETTVISVAQQDGGVEVVFSDDTVRKFDLVIVADGIHSETRKKILNASEYHYQDTGWGGWVTWMGKQSGSTYEEYWGAGSFLGLYPAENDIGVFLGGPAYNIQKKGLKEFSCEVANMLKHNKTFPKEALKCFDRDERHFFWNFKDCRCDVWHKGNVVLLGDAATGFLPTAGVGASMAMDSAAALVDELSRVDREHIQYALDLYTRRQKNRVERAHSDSRKLGKLMFVKSAIIAHLRDRIVSWYSLKRMLADLSKVMEGK